MDFAIHLTYSEIFALIGWWIVGETIATYVQNRWLPRGMGSERGGR
jgi:hypothetical protein